MHSWEHCNAVGRRGMLDVEVSGGQTDIVDDESKAVML